MKIERTRNTITGTITGLLQKIVMLIIPFIIRTIFIHTLGIEYLGLNSLFTSVLQVLNLAELGVGAALVFSMYRPIAEDDNDKICALMGLYRKYYRIIGLVILVLGLAIIPFIPILIKGNPPSDINIYVIYGMSLSNTVLSYWMFAYRNCLFQAHQRMDIVNLISLIISILSYSCQIFCLLHFHNYYLYLGIGILSQLLNNLVTALVSINFYPSYVPKGELEKDEIKEINKKVRSLFTAKLGFVVHRSFDTIVVSSFLGLSLLAIFQNYYYIISSVTGLVMIFYGAAQAGVGNFLVLHNDEAKKELLYKFQFISMMIVCVCSCCFINLYQPFMIMWVGRDYLLPFPLVVLFVISFGLDIFMRPLLMLKDSGGIWNEDKYRPLTVAFTNLGLNLLTVRWLGLYGVIGSTILSMVIVAAPWLIMNINKYMFDFDIRKFLFENLKYSAVIVSCCLCTYSICHLLSQNNAIIDLLVRLVVSLSCSFVIFEGVFFNKKENKYLMSTASRIFRSKWK